MTIIQVVQGNNNRYETVNSTQQLFVQGGILSSGIPQFDGPIPDPYDDVLSTPNVSSASIFLIYSTCVHTHVYMNTEIHCALSMHTSVDEFTFGFVIVALIFGPWNISLLISHQLLFLTTNIVFVVGIYCFLNYKQASVLVEV